MSKCDHPQCILHCNHRSDDGTPCIAADGRVLRLSNKYGGADNLASMVRRLPKDKREKVMAMAADIVADAYEQEAENKKTTDIIKTLRQRVISRSMRPNCCPYESHDGDGGMGFDAELDTRAADELERLAPAPDAADQQAEAGGA